MALPKREKYFWFKPRNKIMHKMYDTINSAMTQRKNIKKGKTSAAYWANKVFWAGKSGSKKRPPKSQKQTFGLKRKRT